MSDGERLKQEIEELKREPVKLEQGGFVRVVGVNREMPKPPSSQYKARQPQFFQHDGTEMCDLSGSEIVNKETKRDKS
jgi:hypothetical protein